MTNITNDSKLSTCEVTKQLTAANAGQTKGVLLISVTMTKINEGAMQHQILVTDVKSTHGRIWSI
jgi:BarA-like signal transduction histidine kinase